jgi:protein-S-isoprenylcysteine O-methyltransferase Ste14
MKMNKLKTKIPPPIIAFCFGLIMWAMSLYLHLYLYLLEHLSLFWIALTCIAIGLYLNIVSFINFVKHKTTVNPISPKKASKLVINGFYLFTRNPMYLGMVFILLGCAFLFGNIGCFLILPFFISTMNYLQIEPEEKVLEKNFGKSYLDYKMTVRRWL